MHKGGKPLNLEIENKLISFIEFNRKFCNPITTFALYLKLLKLWPDRKNKSKHTNYVLIYRILTRHCYTFRTPTHYGQLLKKEAFIDTSLFLNEIRNIRLNNGICDSILGNMDETPIFLNMPITKTIIKKGTKQVIVKTQGQEKCRVTVILTILADGGKLPPLIIFKAKNQWKIYKSLQEDNNVKNGKYYIACNTNAKATEEILHVWFKNIWFNYLESDELNIDGMGYIILDRATSHITNNIITQYNNDSKFMSFIPSGLTRYVQPLDLVVNKPFKEGIKKLYVEHCLESETEFMKISRNKIIDMVTKVWGILIYLKKYDLSFF